MIDGMVFGEDGVVRCFWVGGLGMMRDYYDIEWGVFVSGECGLFEWMCFEGFQVGLFWLMILNKCDWFCEVFYGFDVDCVVVMNDIDVEWLFIDMGIVCNCVKIEATCKNVMVMIVLCDDGGFEVFVE